MRYAKYLSPAFLKTISKLARMDIRLLTGILQFYTLNTFVWIRN
jgi:hypothetical protein